MVHRRGDYHLRFGTGPFKRAALKDARELLEQQIRPLGQETAGASNLDVYYRGVF